jgi:hypothetical protein
MREGWQLYLHHTNNVVCVSNRLDCFFGFQGADRTGQALVRSLLRQSGRQGQACWQWMTYRFPWACGEKGGLHCRESRLDLNLRAAAIFW